MGPYYFILICIFVIMLLCNNNNNSHRRISCVFLAIVLSFIMGFRSVDYAGVDTEVYVRDFIRITDMPMKDFFTEFYKDYFFYIVAKIFSFFCSDENVWMLFCASVYIGIISWFICKYSVNVWYSFLIFVTWDMYAYSFQLMRHVWSLAFVVVSLHFLLKKDYKKYAFAMVAAVGSQIVSIISLLSLIISKLRLKILLISLPFVLSALFLLLFMSRDYLMQFIFSFDILSSNERFASFNGREGGQLSNFFINLLLVLLTLFEFGRNKSSELFLDNQKMATIFLSMSIIGMLFFSLQFVIGEFYRVAQYFSIFNIILIPLVIKMEKNLIMRKSMTLILAAFLIKHFLGGLIGSDEYDPYIFFWE